MRQLKLLTFTIVAMLSLGILATTAAQAVELKALPEKAKFSFKSIGKLTYETLSGKKMECLSMTGTGEGLSERLGDVHFDFTDCLVVGLGVKCASLEDPESTVLVEASYHLRHLLNPNEAWVNLAILVPAMHLSCLGVLFVVKGCFASMDLLTDEKQNVVNLLLKLFLVDFLQEKGEQKPLEIATDNSLGMEKCDLFSKEGVGAEETEGLLGEGEIEKCKNGAAECTFLFELSGIL